VGNEPPPPPCVCNTRFLMGGQNAVCNDHGAASAATASPRAFQRAVTIDFLFMESKVTRETVLGPMQVAGGVVSMVTERSGRRRAIQPAPP
jgi:hypothetical protein